jgi:hypothetical protein
MKSIEERVSECKNIRLQLQSLGVLTSPSIAIDMKINMNMFVVYGEPVTFTIKVPESRVKIIIKLSTNENIKSGVIMEG